MQNTHRQRPKLAQTLMGKADDKLTRAASAVKKYNDDLDYAAEDLAAFGAPSECYTLVFGNGFDEEERMNSVVQPFGYNSYSEFREAAEDRITGKSAYYLLS